MTVMAGSSSVATLEQFQCQSLFPSNFPAHQSNVRIQAIQKQGLNSFEFACPKWVKAQSSVTCRSYLTQILSGWCRAARTQFLWLKCSCFCETLARKLAEGNEDRSTIRLLLSGASP